MSPWFSSSHFHSLLLTRFTSISEQGIDKQIEIKDEKIIRKIIERIESIHPDGDMMISFGPQAEYMTLGFAGNSGEEVINVINKRFKTPSTGFNSSDRDAERILHADLDALLFPDIDKTILLVEGLELHFGNFTITYLGNEFRDFAPAALSFNDALFLIRDKNKKEQNIKITSGQLPPPPMKLGINNNTYSLLTFESHNKERLFPDYFQLIKA